MVKTKHDMLKRLAAFILVLITLISGMSVPAAAGDSVFLETLIDTSKVTYTANFSSDTKNRGSKYAFKYMNMAYVVGEGCLPSSGGAAPANKLDLDEHNPNRCFRLDGDQEYGKSGYSDEFNGTFKPVSVFLLIEGYAKDSSGTLIVNDTEIKDAKKKKHTDIVKSKKYKNGNPLSYPGHFTETVTSEQSEYGQSVINGLVNNLNGILNSVNGGLKFENVTDLVNKSIFIRPDGDSNIVVLKPNLSDGYPGYVIIYGDLQTANNSTAVEIPYETSAGQANRRLSAMKDEKIKVSTLVGSGSENTSYKFLDKYDLPRANTDKWLYAYVFPITTDASGVQYLNIKEATIYPYAAPKGFTEITEPNGTVFSHRIFTEGGNEFKYVTDQGEVNWISIHMLSMYANTVYKHYNVSVSTYVEPESNVISTIIAKMFNGILWGIRSILRLSEIDVLVFNLGARGTIAGNFGLMSETWWNVVLQYQLIFQAIAWVILVCGFIKTLIRLNLSTVNPQTRMSVYDTIQKFIVVGIGLVILVPAVQFLLECNDVIVELFASQIETSSLNMPVVTNVLVQFIVGMVWITLLLYINFIYVMRSITVALLIASGPFFISTIAFSNGKSSLFTSWVKELLANIFVQSIHAFVLSFLVQLLTTGSFLETIAIAISIVPLTETFRALIFGSAGASTSQMASTAAGAVKKVGNAAVKGAFTGAAAALSTKDNEGGDSKDGDSKPGSGGGKGGGGGGGSLQSVMNGKAQSKVQAMMNGTSAGARIKADSAAKNGGKASIGAKIGGATLDVAHLGAMGMASMAEGFNEFDNAMTDLVLKGDASGLAKTVEGRTSGTVTGAVGMAKGAADGKRNKQSMEKQKAQSVNVGSEATMGQMAVNDKNGTNGGVTAGPSAAKIQTSMSNSAPQPTMIKKPDANSSSVDTFTPSNGNKHSKDEKDNMAHAMNAYDSGTNKKTEAAVANINGKDVAGTKYSFTDKNGNDKSFFMTEKQENMARQARNNGAKGTDYATNASAAHEVADKNVNPIKTTDASSSNDDKAHAAMAEKFGTPEGSYYNVNGNKADVSSTVDVKEYNGDRIAVSNDVKNNAGDILKTYSRDQRASAGGAQYNQSLNEFTTQITPSDMGTPGKRTEAQKMNAAMATVVSDQMSKNGVPNSGGNKSSGYQIAGKKYDTGMSVTEAKSYLANRGVTNVTANNGSISYTQKNAEHKPQPPKEIREKDGNTMAKYDLQGMGTFTQQGRSGGEFSFESKDKAIEFFEKNGNTDFANAVRDDVLTTKGVNGSVINDDGTVNQIARAYEDSSTGEYKIQFNSRAMEQEGTKIEECNDGKHFFATAVGSNEVRNPFAIDQNTQSMPTRNVMNVPQFNAPVQQQRRKT